MLRGHEGRGRLCGFQPGRRSRIVSGSADRSLRLWDASSGASLASRCRGTTAASVPWPSVRTARESSPDPGTGPLRVWDAVSGEFLLALRAPDVVDVAFSPDGKWVVATSGRKLVIWGHPASLRAGMIATRSPRSWSIPCHCAAVLVMPQTRGSWTEECASLGCGQGGVAPLCCVPDGSCQMFFTPEDCYNAGGAELFGGPGCVGDGDADGIDDGCGCPGQVGTACCLPDGCQDAVDPAACTASLGGVSFGACATCSEVYCPNPACVGRYGKLR